MRAGALVQWLKLPALKIGDRYFKMNSGFQVLKKQNVESPRNREVACSASDRQGSNFESCIWRAVSSHSSHYRREVLLAQLCAQSWSKTPLVSFPALMNVFTYDITQTELGIFDELSVHANSLSF